MVDIARVNLYGQPVGTFRWDNNRQLAHFEYAESFIGKGLEPSPILMPVRQGRIYSFS
ncbi:HipA N-terminal domain-containing protein, partial [uncultured Muribaculum sp.]